MDDKSKISFNSLFLTTLNQIWGLPRLLSKGYLVRKHGPWGQLFVSN